MRETTPLKIQGWGYADFHTGVSAPTAITVDEHEHVIRDGGGTVEKWRATDGAVTVASFKPATSKRIRDLTRTSTQIRAQLFDPPSGPEN